MGFFSQFVDGFVEERNNIGFVNPSLVAPQPSLPVIQETVIEETENNTISELLSLGSPGVPVAPNVPTAVVSSEVPTDAGNNVPVKPPVFFPDLLPSFVKTVGADFPAQRDFAAEILPPVVAPIVAPTVVTATSSRFSNVDIGLVAVGGAAVVSVGIIAAIRRF